MFFFTTAFECLFVVVEVGEFRAVIRVCDEGVRVCDEEIRVR